RARAASSAILRCPTASWSACSSCWATPPSGRSSAPPRASAPIASFAGRPASSARDACTKRRSKPGGVAARGGRHEFPRPADRALSLDVTEHLVPRLDVLREIHRVLTEDGRLLVSGPNRETRGRRTLREAGLCAYSDPDHKVEYTREEFLAELAAAGFEPDGPVMPVVLDTPWAGAIDAVGGLSLGLYDRLSRWKREAAVRRPEESTGFRVVARKRRA